MNLTDRQLARKSPDEEVTATQREHQHSESPRRRRRRVLCIDPATGIRDSSKATTRYNDFSNLKWLKPVYAGDTITYRTTVTAKRPSASRPEWGLVFHHNTGTNQNGEEVFAFDGMVFWEKRG